MKPRAANGRMRWTVVLACALVSCSRGSEFTAPGQRTDLVEGNSVSNSKSAAAGNKSGQQTPGGMEQAAPPVNVAGTNLTDCVLVNEVRGDKSLSVLCSWNDANGSISDAPKVVSANLKDNNSVTFPFSTQQVDSKFKLRIDNVALSHFLSGAVVLVGFQRSGVSGFTEIPLQPLRAAAIFSDVSLPSIPVGWVSGFDKGISCTPAPTDPPRCTSATPYEYANSMRTAPECNSGITRGDVINKLESAIDAGRLCRSDVCDNNFASFENAIYANCN